MQFLRAARHAGSMRVLIAEDELRLADAIARGLRRQGMAVDLAPDGEQALIKARVVRYDVLVLDRDLPGVHGDDVCRTVRGERPETGILMLTAAGNLEDVVEGLSLGADDYLAKPFRFAELVARIQALARRSTPSRPPLLHHGDLELDPARRGAARGRRWGARPPAPPPCDGHAPKLSIRLTALYGLVFLVTGAVLLTIGYLLVRNNIRAQIGRASCRGRV